MTRQRAWMRAAVLAAVLGAGGFALVSCTDEEPPKQAAPSASSEPVPVILPGKPGESAAVSDAGQVRAPDGSTYNTIDATFAQMMIAHHIQALQMAELAPSRAGNSQLKALAARMQAAQQPEIEYLRDWLADRGKPESDPSHDHSTMPGMQTEAALAALTGSSGADFDQRFVTMMSDHHRGALQMATDVLNGGTDRMLSEFANEMAVEQSAEINRMADLKI
ncbi:DUF305 domain-containing protein [Actinoplanes sp. NPDC051861]|uniref:DUF305 domain-containing protein n=1 Tax=Actinoplanes sp. NPDC051861 TaxID=3155170 RepID=UPI00343AB107